MPSFPHQIIMNNTPHRQNISMPIVTLQISKGRTLEQKKQLVDGITGTIVDALGVDPSWVTILIHELDRENIGKSGILLSEQ
jgi:4-oxalocrotonate tautomerase